MQLASRRQRQRHLQVARAGAAGGAAQEVGVGDAGALGERAPLSTAIISPQRSFAMWKHTWREPRAPSSAARPLAHAACSIAVTDYRSR